MNDNESRRVTRDAGFLCCTACSQLKTNFTIFTDTPPPTVQLLLVELHEVDDWFTFGVALGVTIRKLREIQTSNPQGGVQCWMTDMFQFWLDSTPTASWEDVIRALEQLDHGALAARLRSKYNLSPGMCVLITIPS